MYCGYRFFVFAFIAYAALHGIALNYIIKSFFETY